MQRRFEKGLNGISRNKNENKCQMKITEEFNWESCKRKKLWGTVKREDLKEYSKTNFDLTLRKRWRNYHPHHKKNRYP